MRGPAQTSEPIIQYLYQLIDSIADGRLLIPRFQRPLVWKWDRQSELLRSVKDGIPMGAIMIWRTAKLKIEWQKQLAGHQLPMPEPTINREYLLDGLQRLSTLFAALKGVPAADPENQDIAQSIGYDLEEQAFVQSTDDQERDAVIPLSVLSDSVRLLRFQRTLKGPRADIWVERSDELAKSFREYKVPLIPIVSDDFDVAVRTFNLINTQGAKMGEADMIHALTWSPKFELRDRLESLRSEILQPLGWGSVEFETILKVVKAQAGLDLYDKDAEQVSETLKRKPDAVVEACERLARVATLLRDQCGIFDWELVPYELQAVLLASTLSEPNPDVPLARLLSDWFWVTTYGELFAGLSGYRLAVVVRSMVTLMDDRQIVWPGPSPFRVKPLPVTSDFRSVRIKALALELARQQERCGGSMTPFKLLADHRRDAICQVIPRRFLSKQDFASPGNRFLCAPEDVGALRHEIITGCTTDLTADQHYIPSEARNAAERQDWSSFISARFKLLENAEHRFLDQILRRNPDIGSS